MMRRDKEYGKDPTKVHKTANFNLPVRRYRSGEYKGLYKIPSGSTIFTCFTSDFFHPAADEWRAEAWAMMRERSDCNFFMVTKRPERIAAALPADWGETGYDNVQISCTCENQYWADRRLPIFLSLPLPHKSITHEPMLERINIRKYLKEYGEQIESVSCGGESGPEARICDYAWVLDTHMQCVEYSVPFYYHQTGARLRKGNKIYEIPREHQHTQAHKAHLDFDGTRLPAWDEPDTEAD
jgi:protein gp37